MICEKCNGLGYIRLSSISGGICGNCNGTGIVETMTNEEWRKTCSAEEFAEWITDKINAKLSMALHDAELYPDDINENEYMENENEWLEWLKQPHGGES